MKKILKHRIENQNLIMSLMLIIFLLLASFICNEIIDDNIEKHQMEDTSVITQSDKSVETVGDVEGYSRIVNGISSGIGQIGVVFVLGFVMLVGIFGSVYILFFTILARIFFKKTEKRILIYRVLSGFCYVGYGFIGISYCFLLNIGIITTVIGIYAVAILVISIKNTYTNRVWIE